MLLITSLEEVLYMLQHGIRRNEHWFADKTCCHYKNYDGHIEKIKVPFCLKDERQAIT